MPNLNENLGSKDAFPFNVSVYLKKKRNKWNLKFDLFPLICKWKYYFLFK